MCYLILGSKKYKGRARTELENNPIDFEKFRLKENQKEKYWWLSPAYQRVPFQQTMTKQGKWKEPL